MPLFGYSCDECGAEIEVLVRGESEPSCPRCGSRRLSRLASAFTPLQGSTTHPKASVPCGASACCRAENGSCPYS
jgi:putative FmdB family regulatory protein